MATARPFAYNTGTGITGTTQIGFLAVGYPGEGAPTTGLEWWNGPDEDLGYVIAQSVPNDSQPTPVPDDAITLSTTYKGIDIALSNNNQTASQIFSYSQTVLGETIISGISKVMFSVQYTSTDPSVGVGGHFIGVGLTGMNYSGPFDGYPGNDTNSIGFSDDGNYYFNGSSVQSGLPTWTSGDIIDIAIASGQYWWIRVNGGDWNNNPSANPTTLANGSLLNGLTNFYPALCPYIYGTMSVLNYPKYGFPSDYNFLGNVTASVGFFRSADLTEGSFITLSETIAGQSFATGDDAKTWLNNNGYWTSYSDSLCDSFTFNSINANTTTTSAIKTTAGGWDASAYSTETYTTPVTLTFQTTANGNYLMGGFSYSPTANSETYINTTYGLYVQPGFLEIYENGGQATVPGAMTTLSTDVWKVEYNGTNVRYYKNDGLIYTSSNPVTQPLHVFFALLEPAEGVNNVCLTY
jgi:hypothetical protein